MELVNPVPVHDARGWLGAAFTTFLLSPHDDHFGRQLDHSKHAWLADRTWGYRDRGRWVATLMTMPRSVTVPGPDGTTRDVEADALTNVTVAATHRRRGLLTSMITESLGAAKDRGDALSMLIATEWPVYGRFGYAPAVANARFSYHPRRPHATLPAAPSGSLRQVEPTELGETAAAIFDAARRLRPGQVDRCDPWWDARLGLSGFEPVGMQPHWILHEGPDGPDGLLAWKATQHFRIAEHLGAIDVEEFVAANDTAYKDLWSYLGGIDVIEQVKLDARPIDEPVRWLLPDGRSLEQTGSYDSLWIRLLDVPAALSARSYAVPGRIVLEVVDDGLGRYGAGRFVLDTDGTNAECKPTTKSADLRVSQRALAACYLGGRRLRQLALDGVDELMPGKLERADLMFSFPFAPWNQTRF